MFPILENTDKIELSELLTIERGIGDENRGTKRDKKQ